ncbi:MAG: hypothetical protein RL346_157 [Verrucomicrobiota bacterium]
MSFQNRMKAAKHGPNRKRGRTFPYDGLVSVSRRAHERADRELGRNRKLNQRVGKSVWASIAVDDMEIEPSAPTGFLGRFFRWVLGMVLLPVCWVTLWTFLETFKHATVEQGWWQSPQFWYFAVGVLLMLGWFFSKIGQSLFLYLYVFGHELTHAVCVKCFGGKVYGMEWSSKGGYVTTDKSNWVISLSPYFVPFWSVVAVVLYAVPSMFWEIPEDVDLVFYGIMGASWAFHMAWTAWMIPRDQPDLHDSGMFLSLVLILLGNLLVLIALFCFASQHPIESFRNFGYSWFAEMMTWGDIALRWLDRMLEQVPQYL